MPANYATSGEGLGLLIVMIPFAIILILIQVAIVRWIFRINRIIELLERIEERLRQTV